MPLSRYRRPGFQNLYTRFIKLTDVDISGPRRPYNIAIVVLNVLELLTLLLEQRQVNDAYQYNSQAAGGN
jgi:hypothetical protein